LPKGKTHFPVVLLVHGGAWMVGDKCACGLYGSVGEFLASQGFGVVMPNYRLSPAVRHPAHVKDLARAFAWAHDHIGDFGGNPDQIFLIGHSAGGHLAALLATDESYLRAEGCRGRDIKGVVLMSGVYRIPLGRLELTYGGESPAAFRFDELVPFRGGGWSWSYPPGLPGVPVTVNVFSPVFGDDLHLREDASPLSHVRPGLPPFLIFYAERDLPTLPGMAEEFHQALVAQGCSSDLVRVPSRNHNSLCFRAIRPDDPVAQSTLAFLNARTQERQVVKTPPEAPH
jgi:acetyl esterase/lipase